MNYDKLFINGNIISMDSRENRYTWIAVKDNKIAEIGSEQNCPENAGQTIDLEGKTVLPGFIDSHLHGSLTGLSLASADLRNANSVSEAMELLGKKCNQTPKGGLVIGTNLSAETLLEKRLPTRMDLDEVSTENPILVHHVTMHGCVVNTMAFALSQLNTSMDGVETYDDGSPNGIISDDSAYYIGVGNIMANVTEETIEGFIKEFTDSLPSKGLTSVHTLDGQDIPADIRVWHRMQGKHPINVVNYLETLDVELASSLGYPRVGGCIALDGSRVMKTMAINEPYANSPSRGTLYYTDDTIYKFMSAAHERNMQLSLHVGGERAIDQFIYTLYRVEKEQGFKDLRHRPEHFSMPSSKAIDLAVEMQLALPMQPMFTRIWDDPEDSLYVKNFGAERAKQFEAFADIIKKGGMICGGSDSPISESNPLAGIHICVNSLSPHRKTSVTEAIKMFTYNGAWAAHEDKERGTLEKGKYADMVVLDRDPYKYPDKIEDLKVEMTVSEGQIVYQSVNTVG